MRVLRMAETASVWSRHDDCYTIATTRMQHWMLLIHPVVRMVAVVRAEFAQCRCPPDSAVRDGMLKQSLSVFDANQLPPW